jgi:S-DNA-T family DNA segregation ATPase FtsK/SpoIIIE
MSSDQRGGMSTALASSVQRRIVMRMADPEDYGFLATPATILTPDSPPGRCVVDDSEVQVAVLGTGTDAQSQAVALHKFGIAMRNSGVAAAPAIQRLPEVVTAASLAHKDALLTIGMESEGFGPAVIQPKGPFVVTGPTGSGRTTALMTIVAELRRIAMPIHLLADRRSELTAADGMKAVVGAEPIMLAADDLVAALESLPEAAPRHAFVIEGLGELTGTEAEFGLANLIRVALANDHFVIADGEVNSLVQAYELMKRFKAGRRGLVLQPDDGMAHLLQSSFPRCQSTDFGAGRGFLVERGTPRLIQVAMAAGGHG